MGKHPTLFITQRGLRHQQAALTAAPPELDVTIRRDPPKAEILALLPEMEFLISERSGEIDADIIAAGRNLRLIQRLGSRTWDIDLEAARRAGVPVCYWPVQTCILVAEHMILQMLGLAKRLRELMQITSEAGDWGQPPRRCDEDYFAYNWSRRETIDGLWHKTVGILGFGEIGTELARRLRGFECTVLYTKRHRLPAKAEAELHIAHASQDELTRRSDFICSLLPFFSETEMSLNASFFGAMKPGAFFVHCGAGAVVDEGALIEALRSGHLAGAALDTYTYEPLRPDELLLELARNPWQNLILTPHVAAGSIAAQRDERVRDYDNLKRALAGEPLLYRLA